jgi:site-specific DNA recombinase
MNPEEQWVRKHVPDLRIIQQDIFEAVQKLKTERGGARPDQQRKPRHLLSGSLDVAVAVLESESCLLTSNREQ